MAKICQDGGLTRIFRSKFVVKDLGRANIVEREVVNDFTHRLRNDVLVPFEGSAVV